MSSSFSISSNDFSQHTINDIIDNPHTVGASRDNVDEESSGVNSLNYDSTSSIINNGQGQMYTASSDGNDDVSMVDAVDDAQEQEGGDDDGREEAEVGEILSKWYS